jgi:hypothetical protein
MPPTESVVATSSMLICHYWSPYLSKRDLSERETVLEAQLTGLGLWKIKYRRISTIRIMTLTGTGSSTLVYTSTVHSNPATKGALKAKTVEAISTSIPQH